MENFIEYSVLDTVLEGIHNYELTKDITHIAPIQDEIKLARDIDYSIKTKSEYDNKATFDESSHNPARMAVFKLNKHGEFYIENGIVIIKNDDPCPVKNSHTNTYRLTLKDPETHLRLYRGNPTKQDEPYDFNTMFISQITHYPNGAADSTPHPWESFSNPKKGLTCGYRPPARKLDFKSALWKKKGEHDTHYILQLQRNGQLVCMRSDTKEIKDFTFIPAPGVEQHRVEYFKTLDLIDFFNQHNCLDWNKYIID